MVLSSFGLHSLQNFFTAQSIRKAAQAKYIASAIHALLFLSMWVLYWASSRPLMDGPSALPFAILYVADLPISCVAFGVIFTSSENGTLAAVLWGVFGTLWWFRIGLAIDTRIRSFRKKRDKTTEHNSL